MDMLQEMREQGFKANDNDNQMHCKAFQDNTGSIALAKVPKIRPRTRHINAKYFHFLQYTVPQESGKDPLISIHKLKTEDMPADTLTKSNNERTLRKHRKFIWGW